MSKERTEQNRKDERQIKDELIKQEAPESKLGLSVDLMTHTRQVHPVPDHHPHQTSYFLQLHTPSGEQV